MHDGTVTPIDKKYWRYLSPIAIIILWQFYIMINCPPFNVSVRVMTMQLLDIFGQWTSSLLSLWMQIDFVQA